MIWSPGLKCYTSNEKSESHSRVEHWEGWPQSSKIKGGKGSEIQVEECMRFVQDCRNLMVSEHWILTDYRTGLRGLSSDLLAIETIHQTLLFHQLSVGRDKLGNEALVSWKITLSRLMESGKYRQLTPGLACLTSFSPQWCHHRIMLCFTYRSLEISSKKVHCHLQQMVLHVGLLACFLFFFHLLYRTVELMSWHEHFSNRKNRHSGHVLNENFIKSRIQGRKLYTHFQDALVFLLSSFLYTWKIPALSSLCCTLPLLLSSIIKAVLWFC